MTRPSIPFRVACWIAAALLFAAPALQSACSRACCAQASMQCCAVQPDIAEATAVTSNAHLDRNLHHPVIRAAEPASLQLLAAVRASALPAESASPPGRQPSLAILRI